MARRRSRRSRLIPASGDPDALLIDPRPLLEMSGNILHFFELQLGDLFLEPARVDDNNDVWPSVPMIYMGEGWFMPAANVSVDLQRRDPTSGMLVELLSHPEDE